MFIDLRLYQEFLLISNCLNDGWCVKKKNDKLILFRKHQKSKKYFKKKYLKEFLENNTKEYQIIPACM